MKSSLFCCLLLATTTVVHGAVCAANAATCNGVCLNNADYTPDALYTDIVDCKAMVSVAKFTNEAQCTGAVGLVSNVVGQKCCGTCKFIHDDSVACVFLFSDFVEASTSNCENRRI